MKNAHGNEASKDRGSAHIDLRGVSSSSPGPSKKNEWGEILEKHYYHEQDD
jgi:hypothetical protein